MVSKQEQNKKVNPASLEESEGKGGLQESAPEMHRRAPKAWRSGLEAHKENSNKAIELKMYKIKF